MDVSVEEEAASAADEIEQSGAPPRTSNSQATTSTSPPSSSPQSLPPPTPQPTTAVNYLNPTSQERNALVAVATQEPEHPTNTSAARAAAAITAVTAASPRIRAAAAITAVTAASPRIIDSTKNSVKVKALPAATSGQRRPGGMMPGQRVTHNPQPNVFTKTPANGQSLGKAAMTQGKTSTATRTTTPARERLPNSSPSILRPSLGVVMHPNASSSPGLKTLKKSTLLATATASLKNNRAVPGCFNSAQEGSPRRRFAETTTSPVLTPVKGGGGGKQRAIGSTGHATHAFASPPSAAAAAVGKKKVMDVSAAARRHSAFASSPAFRAGKDEVTRRKSGTNTSTSTKISAPKKYNEVVAQMGPSKNQDLGNSRHETTKKYDGRARHSPARKLQLIRSYLRIAAVPAARRTHKRVLQRSLQCLSEAKLDKLSKQTGISIESVGLSFAGTSRPERLQQEVVDLSSTTRVHSPTPSSSQSSASSSSSSGERKQPAAQAKQKSEPVKVAKPAQHFAHRKDAGGIHVSAAGAKVAQTKQVPRLKATEPTKVAKKMQAKPTTLTGRQHLESEVPRLKATEPTKVAKIMQAKPTTLTGRQPLESVVPRLKATEPTKVAKKMQAKPTTLTGRQLLESEVPRLKATEPTKVATIMQAKPTTLTARKHLESDKATPAKEIAPTKLALPAQPSPSLPIFEKCLKEYEAWDQALKGPKLKKIPGQNDAEVARASQKKAVQRDGIVQLKQAPNFSDGLQKKTSEAKKSASSQAVQNPQQPAKVAEPRHGGMTKGANGTKRDARGNAITQAKPAELSNCPPPPALAPAEPAILTDLDRLQKETRELHKAHRPVSSQATLRSFALEYNECSVIAVAKWVNFTSTGRTPTGSTEKTIITIPTSDANFRKCSVCGKWGHLEVLCKNLTSDDSLVLQHEMQELQLRRDQATEVTEFCEGFAIEQRDKPFDARQRAQKRSRLITPGIEVTQLDLLSIKAAPDADTLRRTM